MIELCNIGCCYPNGENEMWAVRDVNFTVNESKFISIVGKSGSGKSTLLKIIGGLKKPSEGKIFWNGEDIYSYSDYRLAKYRSTNIGFVFQNYILEEQFTVYRNVEIALMISGYPEKKRRRKIVELLTYLEIENKMNITVKKLSGGEKQRVCIARALVNDADLILADEPCGNLDSYNGKKVMEQFRKIVESGKTVVLVTHNSADAHKTDEIITLNDGMIVKHEIKG